MEKEVPIADKAFLTIDEAAAYFNIGLHKLRELTDGENNPYCIWNGRKRLIKREALLAYLLAQKNI